jgi:SSS family solute:Na+ symporter
MSSVIIAFAILVLTTLFSLYFAVRGRKIDLREWAIGGRRGFGTVLFWFLSAGEIFTTFAFLGASGWAYQYGAPGFYIFANVTLGYTLGYWLLPRIWEISKQHDIYTQGDFFQLRFESRWLSGLITGVGILAIIPYAQLQLTGISLIIQIVFKGIVSKPLAVLFAGAIVLAFVFTAGLRGTALAAIVKDFLMVGVLIAVTATLASILGLHNILEVFTRLGRERPMYSQLPGLVPAKHFTSLWFMSVILMTNVGFWMWPHAFQATCSAASKDAIRRNAIFQPLYALAYFFVFLLGLAALLVIPNLKDSNTALLSLIAHSYPGWFLGIVGGTGLLIGVIPCSALLLTLGTIFAKNIYRKLIAPAASDQSVLTAGRIAAVLGAIASVWLTLRSNATIVAILLVAYSAISQIGPGFILSLLWKRVTGWGVLIGSLVGLLGILVPPMIRFEDVVSFSMDHGFIALLLNLVVTVAVSWVTARPSERAIQVGIGG